MSELEEITNNVKSMVKEDNNVNATFKFILDGQSVYIDATQKPPIINNDDKDADCSIIMSVENAKKFLRGDLNPMTAYMLGKIKIKGDMGIALKLSQLIGKP